MKHKTQQFIISMLVLFALLALFGVLVGELFRMPPNPARTTIWLIAILIYSTYKSLKLIK